MKMTILEQNDTNSFLHKYINGDSHVMELFDYPLTSEGINARLSEISSRSYEREKLAHALQSYNERFTTSIQTFQQINRLKDPRSVVVVGGQQAGLLTGPLYTVNKVISILHEAALLEKKLSIPVIPIFWIAGEDHDIEEVNHTYFYSEDETKKIMIHERNDWKQPVSERKIKSEISKAIIKEAFQFVQETEHTKKLVEELFSDVKEELTYVEWFSLLIHRLFSGTGLVLMDAQDPQIRAIEKEYFKEMIVNNDLLRESFVSGAERMRGMGFGEPISVQEENAHLFIHEAGERLLLEKRDGMFYEKNGSRCWGENELLHALELTPFPFSNNVVSRPVMQDLLFPVLAFIAGPGELKYWGTLKNVFHTFHIRMPLVFPRTHITYLTRKTEKSLAWIGVSPSRVIKNGLAKEREKWLRENTYVNLDEVFHSAQMSLETLVDELNSSLSPLGKEVQLQANRYETKLEGVLVEYKKRVEHSVKVKNEAILKRFDQVETEIVPAGTMQERYLNIFPFINLYGDDLLQRVVHSLKEEASLIGKDLYVYL